MSHWSATYLHLPWTDETCCGHYFILIQKEVFGRNIKGLGGISGALPAARIMAAILAEGEGYGYKKTEVPHDGDAVFLSQRNRPHHIGTVAMINGIFHVVHALENCGVIVSDHMDLNFNFWKIAGFWTWKQ